MIHYKLLLLEKDLEIIPALHWPIPQVTSNMLSNEGPVLIQTF
jgi:hypothetical protein